MFRKQLFLFFFLPLFFLGCAQTSVLLMDESKKFAPSDDVKILEQAPSVQYMTIAILETRGSAGQSITYLLNQARKEARKIGADAILPIEERQEYQPQGLFYNPWLGGYQTIGGWNLPIIRCHAIIYEKSIPMRAALYKPDPLFNGGISINSLMIAFGGYGLSGWVGKNKIRAVVDIHSSNTPSAMLRDGFEDGKIENTIRLGIDYFFQNDISGPYFGSGFQFGNYSVGHEYTDKRGNWETLDFGASFGYFIKFSPHIHLDLRIALDATLFGEDEIIVGNYIFCPDKGKLYAQIGFGVNF